MTNLFVMTTIAGKSCALPAHDVQSVIELGSITPVPRAPDHISGITALRSQALTVIDCRRALGFDTAERAADPRAAVVHLDGHAYALMVDSIEDIASASDEPGQVPGGFGSQWSRVATGMIETATGPALLIDLAALISPPRKKEPEIGAAA
ncbi:chemotaxis protein CheW [Erythrobacter sp. JK5]|uniref:chemotaxis protein CheW n=1 Tax=Erythrobacter sp. JK5 TaxID=2829500 RepID=UPI001BAAFF91|nr:chemotaxis protein CheW [Erythrobacter sp. JK5]QUL36717.1 chemotaxis protein CheW [Erythrobacter sp. JK5]